MGNRKSHPVRIGLGEQESFLYVIHEADAPTICKIGVAADVAQRLRQMQVGTWRVLKVRHSVKVPSKSAAHAVERQVHQALQGVHLRGEWFSVAADKAAAEVDLAVNQLRAVFAAAAQACSV